MSVFTTRLVNDRSAATAIEYGLLAGLIAVGAMAALLSFGSSANAMYSFISDTSNEVIDEAKTNGGL